MTAPVAPAEALVPPQPTGLGVLDWSILLLYLLSCLAIGWWAMRQVQDAGGFLMARRRLGKVMSLAAGFAGGVNANDPVAVTAKVYVNGVSGVWTALNFLLMAPWYWIRDPVGRRLRLVTNIDVFQLRFGPTVARFGLVVGIFGAVINLALGIKAASMVVIGVAGGPGALAFLNITGDPKRDAMILAAAIVVVPTLIYTVMGGIIAACATDVFMSVLIIALSFVVIPFAWNAVGGLDAMRAGLPPGHLDIISKNADFTAWGIAWFIVGWILTLGPAPSPARDEMTARIGGLGILFKRFCTLGWGALGLFGVLLYSTGHGLSPAFGDEVFARISVDLLPAGLRGMMVAAILAAAMSTIAGMSLGFSGMVLKNIWQPLVRPDGSPAHYLKVVRWLTVIVLLLSWLVAIVDGNDIFTFFSNLALLGSLMGLCYLAAFMWRRVTRAGAIASIVVMAPTVVIAFAGGDLTRPWHGAIEWVRIGWVGWLRLLESGYLACGIDSVPLARVEGLISSAPLAIRFPAQLLPGIAALVVGSLLSKQHNERHVEEFYARLDTPVGDEHLLRERGIQVDALEDLGSDADVTTHDPSKRLLFLDLLYLPGLLSSGKARIGDYRIDLLGAGALMVFIALFLFGMDWLVSLLQPQPR